MKNLLICLSFLLFVSCSCFQGKPWVIVVDGSCPECAKSPNIVLDGSVKK